MEQNMAEEKSPVYDPNPISAQIGMISALDEVKPEDLQSPKAAKVFLQNYTINLFHLKDAQVKLDRILKENTYLVQQREILNVNLAKAMERLRITWIEIPVSLFGGYGLNIITQDSKSSMGWMICIFTVLILITMRLFYLIDYINKQNRGNNYEEKNN